MQEMTTVEEAVTKEDFAESENPNRMCCLPLVPLLVCT